jgi:hypothetical protein
LIVAAPPTVMVPIAAVLATGTVASFAVVGIDRRISARALSGQRAPRQKSDLSAPATERIRIREAVGVISLVLLLIALVSPAGLRVVLSAAGLFGLMVFRLAAADAGRIAVGRTGQRARRREPA